MSRAVHRPAFKAAEPFSSSARRCPSYGVCRFDAVGAAAVQAGLTHIGWSDLCPANRADRSCGEAMVEATSYAAGDYPS